MCFSASESTTCRRILNSLFCDTFWTTVFPSFHPLRFSLLWCIFSASIFSSVYSTRYFFHNSNKDIHWKRIIHNTNIIIFQYKIYYILLKHFIQNSKRKIKERSFSSRWISYAKVHCYITYHTSCGRVCVKHLVLLLEIVGWEVVKSQRKQIEETKLHFKQTMQQTKSVKQRTKTTNQTNLTVSQSVFTLMCCWLLLSSKSCGGIGSADVFFCCTY